MDNDTGFEIGLVMAGAISAGAYSAGVIDFIFEALDAYYASKNESSWDGPIHNVRIPVMSGASAGGMTAAIAALHAFHDLTPVRPSAPPPSKSSNRLYASWVTDITIEKLLQITDLIRGTPVKSALCSDPLDTIVDEAFTMDGPPRRRDWIGRGDDASLRVMFTLTNTRGVPYAFKMFGASSPKSYGMLNHGDYLDFCVGMPGSRLPGVYPLDVTDTSQPSWTRFKKAALATGAFPVGLAPRQIERVTDDYQHSLLVGYEPPPEDRFQTIPPYDGLQTLPRYDFIAIDGGTIDNEPLELARRFIADRGHNEQDGNKANRAVVLVAPFPNFASVPKADDKDYLVHVVPHLLSMLVEQARFKPDELAKAENDAVFSRFMIWPTRPGNGTALAEKYPIASGTLGGFGGFLHESFRRHDYLLGRRNAQAFLRWNFALPETNPLFRAYQASPHWKDRERWYVRDVEGATGTIGRKDEAKYPRKPFALGDRKIPMLPIIPLTDDACTPVDIGADDLPKPDEVALDTLGALINRRAGAVVGGLIDNDLYGVIGGGIMGTLLRPFAKGYATRLATSLASKLIQQAVDDVRGAFG